FDLRLWPEFLSSGSSTSAPAYIDQVSIDSRRIHSKNALFVALSGNSHDGHEFVAQAQNLGAKYAIVSRKWIPPSNLSDIQLIAVDSPLKALQSLVRAYRLTQKAKVITIAGTYGKTMVKDLLHLILSQHYQITSSPESFNSQIGVPLSLLTIKSHHEIALIETSISEKGEMQALGSITLPDAVIISPIGKKHLATLKDLKTIEFEILSLLDHAKHLTWALLPNTLKTTHSHITTHFWNISSKTLPHAELIEELPGGLQSYRLTFPDGNCFEGQISSGFYYFFNLINIVAKAAWLLKIPAQTTISVIANYRPEPMRTEIWKSQQGATFINDSYCSDPQSVDQALKLYQQSPGKKRIFIFGDLQRKKEPHKIYSEYKRIGNAIARHHIDHLYLIGDHSFDGLIDELKHNSSSTAISHFASYPDAFSSLRPSLHPSDLVLIKGKSKLPLDFLMETFNDSINSNQCIINLDAIKNNIAIIRSHLPSETRLMVMVKAFAYGTGELQLAKFLTTYGVDILGVSNVDEAVALKSAGVTQSVFIIHAAPYEAAKVVKWGFEVGVSDHLLIEKLHEETQKQNRKIFVHLHINTGMGRFGCRPEEALTLAYKIQQSSLLELSGIMTHFAVADSAEEDRFTFSQCQTFDQVIQTLSEHGIHPPWKHAANSSATMRFNLPQYNMVRIGLALYGLHAFENALSHIELRQAISLVSRIVGINYCQKGETISYGRTYTVTDQEQRIGILPLGYFDGIHRIYSNKGYVLIRGMKAPIVGKICMDYMMINITHLPFASIGEPVLIFGEDDYAHTLPPQEFANQGNSIVHELITCLGPRIPRIFIHEEKA
ncbi:MAG: alanine racemase, partial [Parachlamydiaceae bacterium]